MEDEPVEVIDLPVLRSLNVEALRAEWRRRFRAPPPALRGPDLLRRALADRIQMEGRQADPDLAKRIDVLVRAQLRGERPKVAAPLFRPGAILLREYQG